MSVKKKYLLRPYLVVHKPFTFVELPVCKCGLKRSSLAKTVCGKCGCAIPTMKEYNEILNK